MVLDLDWFRSESGGNPDEIKENQKRRFKDVSLIDIVVKSDIKWRQCRYTSDKLNSLINNCSKEISIKVKNKGKDEELENFLLDLSIEMVSPELLKKSSISQIKKICLFVEQKLKENEAELLASEKSRKEAIAEIGNILHCSVPISENENDNEITFTSGNVTLEKPYSHVDLIYMIDGVDTKSGTDVAGGRGYYLKGPCVLLQTALVQMALHKWSYKGYQPIYTPYFMCKEVMQEVAQLSQFDDELYRVVGKVSTKNDNLVEDEKYLIATSEQPLAALHRNQWVPEASLPIRYIGQSTCFRQEVGSHGRDTAGIFRVHQFEKIEQFVLTSPNNNESWDMMEEMINNCKEFYEELGIAFRVVNIVSGALNNSAAKKLDLEGWFPGSRAFRELVSCSNCLDYQARRLLVRYGQKKGREKTKFVHMLNATACATTRVICAILETYQVEGGVQIPTALKKYFPPGYPDIIPYKKNIQVGKTKK